MPRVPSTVPTRETAAEIDTAAADWAVRHDRGLSAAEAEALDEWLAGDVRRAGAFARARAFGLHAERARGLGSTYDPGHFEPEQFQRATARPARGVSRRQWLWGAVAAGAGGVVVTGGALLTRGDQVVTRPGELRVLPLADGSVVTLNTRSKLRVNVSGHDRQVDLLEGEALFDVMQAAQAPFVVRAGDAEVIAEVASFTVRYLLNQPVELLVRSGVARLRGATDSAMTVGANTHAVMPSDRRPSVSAIEPEAVERSLAWREGRIAFEGDTLRQAATEFARYSNIRIVIDDPAVAGERITGLFQANDPVGFARAVALSFGWRAEIGENEVRLSR